MIEFDSSELWLPVVGYEDHYEVSNFGRVRSVPRVVEGRWGPTKRLGCMLAIKPANGRYLKVSLCKDGVLTQHQVHRLVLLAFVGEPPKGFVCDHIDCDIRNNNLTNLRWLSLADNARRRTSTKLSKELVINIKNASKQGRLPKEIAEAFEVPVQQVYQIANGRRWKDVT
jgi:hypothetical protein